jgi:hypothetical protein
VREAEGKKSEDVLYRRWPADGPLMGRLLECYGSDLFFGEMEEWLCLSADMNLSDGLPFWGACS